MTTENTAMTVQARAALALESSTAETYLTELAGKSKAIVSITNKDGRTECHAAAMTAKKARINIEKAGESAREDATAFSKAVISEEARLVALIKPEETRLLGLRDDWDAKVKAEKEAAEALERQRIEAIKARIAEFGAMVTDAAMLEAHGVEQEIEVALAVEIDDAFGEFYDEAVTVKAASIAKLRDLLAAKTAAESTAARIKAEQEAETIRLAEEAKRLAAERAEMDRIAAAQRAEQAEMQRQEDARQAEERARLNAERLAFEAQQAAVRAQQDRVAAELERQRREFAEAQAKAQHEADEKAAAIQAEADAKIAADKAEADRIAAEEIRKLDEQRKAEAMTVAKKLAEETKPDITKSFDQTYPNGEPMYSKTTIKENGDPMMLDPDGKRSVFCDIDEGHDEPVKAIEPSSRNDMKRLQFRSELITRIDAMNAVQMANLIAYLDAQVIRERMAA